MLGAQDYAERATSDMLIGPDWSINLELCDAVNSKPRELKDALKVLKKRLAAKSSNIQILALVALETLAKNCGTIVFKQMVEREILIDMVKTVKKTGSLNVKEKILCLINEWQAASGGQQGAFPQYFSAYNDLILEGFIFPPREESSALYQDEKDSQNLHQSDASAVSLEDMKNADGVVTVLSDMLNALDLRDPEFKQELIVDLVETCRSYQKRIAESANTTTDEKLLGRKLTLNDNLQRVILRYEAIVEGTSDTETASAPVLDVCDDSSDDWPPVDLNSLKSKSSSSSQVVPRILPPPTQSKVSHSDNLVDFGQSLSEEVSVPSTGSSQMKAVEVTEKEVVDSDNFVGFRQSSSEDISAPPVSLPATPQANASSRMKEVEDIGNEKRESSGSKKTTDRLFDELMEEFWNIKNKTVK